MASASAVNALADPDLQFLALDHASKYDARALCRLAHCVKSVIIHFFALSLSFKECRIIANPTA
jgi:hypothetical protein